MRAIGAMSCTDRTVNVENTGLLSVKSSFPLPQFSVLLY